MKQLNTLIVDDEEFARTSLYFLVQNHCPEINVCGFAKSVNEAKEILQQHKVDLIFLDIAMPGENGFTLIPFLQKSKTTVVFTTAYDQYALKAIKANAIDYLLKPIDIDELKDAVAKAQHQHQLIQNFSNVAQLESLEHDLKSNKGISKISIPSSVGYRLIEIANIVYIEADSNYSIIKLKNGEKITVSKILKEYEEILPENLFFRVHKSSLVNLQYIQEFHNKNSLSLVMQSGDIIAVSRRRAVDFLEKIKSINFLHS